MAGLFAPHRHDLWHDAGEIRVHDPCIEPSCGPFGDQVEDGNVETCDDDLLRWG